MSKQNVTWLPTTLGCVSFCVLVACAADPGREGSIDEPSTESDALWARRTVKWPADSAGNTTIRVCWESRGYAYEKSIVRSAIVGSWGSVSRVSFVGWSDCTTPVTSDVRLAISSSNRVPGVARDTRGNSLFGAALRRVPAGVTFNFAYQNWDSEACVNGTIPTDSCTRAVAIHEFGHVLGFLHEQDRDDAQDCGSDTGTSRVNGLILTGYDRRSMMNYCRSDYWTNPGLSTGDIAGIQRWYGIRP